MIIRAIYIDDPISQYSICLSLGLESRGEGAWEEEIVVTDGRRIDSKPTVRTVGFLSFQLIDNQRTVMLWLPQ